MNVIHGVNASPFLNTLVSAVIAPSAAGADLLALLFSGRR